MAWKPDSNVERGLYGSILATKRLAVSIHLVVITDGEQNVKELHQDNLQVLASITGLAYQCLESPEQFSKALISDAFAEQRCSTTG